MESNIKAELDLNLIQEKANEYATKGTLEAIQNFYNGYNSPYKNAIEEKLKDVSTNNIEIPDIIGKLNESISNEVDKIANEAIVRTYLPQVKKLFTRIEDKILFSDFLKEFITAESSKYYFDDMYQDEFECIIDKNEKYGWLDITLSNTKTKYNFVLHKTNNDSDATYYLANLPRITDDKHLFRNEIKIETDDITIKMPFVKDVIKDKFISFLTRVILCASEITIDTDYFDNDMFPERCHYH